jgi:hypothetical protein
MNSDSQHCRAQEDGSCQVSLRRCYQCSFVEEERSGHSGVR